MRVPAVCNSCDTIFPSGIEATNSTNIGFEGCGAGPCPKCGGMGHIPDGLYNFIGNTIELLSGPTRTVAELQRLAEILKQARAEGASPEQISKKIEEEVPEISSIKDMLPKTRSEIVPFIGVAIAAIQLILGQAQCPDRSKVEVSQVVNVIYQEAQPSQPPSIEVEKKVPKLAIPKSK